MANKQVDKLNGGDNAKVKINESDITDVHGDKFNRELHVAGKDGQPRFTGGGAFVKKRNRTGAPTGNPPTAKTKAEASRVVGGRCADLILATLEGIGGDEWAPAPSERELLRGAFADYSESKGFQDLPPGILLASAIIAYAGPRVVNQLKKGTGIGGAINRVVDKVKRTPIKKPDTRTAISMKDARELRRQGISIVELNRKYRVYDGNILDLPADDLPPDNQGVDATSGYAHVDGSSHKVGDDAA